MAVTPSLLRAGLRTRWSGEVVQLVALEAAGVADVGEDRAAVGDGEADSNVALLVLGDAGAGPPPTGGDQVHVVPGARTEPLR